VGRLPTGLVSRENLSEDEGGTQVTIAKAIDASFHRTVEWHAINWRKANRYVNQLQARIVKAIEVNDYRKAASLQRLLTHSFYAKALAVRRVTENKGKKSSGIDGVLWDTPQAKAEAINKLQHHRYRPMPLRRILISKGKGKGFRKLGIPSMKDRAMQSLWLIALDPIAETTGAFHSYGFRKGRSCADAIDQCFRVLSQRVAAQWVLEADIKKCFDEISHKFLESNIPMDKRVLHKWLKSGFIEKGKLNPTKEGTPQGSIISPTLANMVLDGLETQLKEKFASTRKQKREWKVNIIRYADDLVITGTSKELLSDLVKPVVEDFLKERGLELSQEKTKITHIDEGFDFLGFNLRKYSGKLLIKPSKKAQKRLLQKVREKTRKLRTAPQWMLIHKLNEIIRGWGNYYRHVVSKKIFADTDSKIWKVV